jgi:hypothetical protein
LYWPAVHKSTDGRYTRDPDALLARAGAVALNETGRPAVLVATVEDLLAIAEHSPWSEDALYKAGLRAVLASSGHRTARRARSR